MVDGIAETGIEVCCNPGARRVERDDYTIDRVFFESFPGHYVTGSLYLPKNRPANGKLPGVLSAHGHWPKARDQDNGAGSNRPRQRCAEFRRKP